MRLRSSSVTPLVAAIIVASLVSPGRPETTRQRPFDGLNVIAVPGHQFGSATAKHALVEARELGARAVAIIPFLWQASPTSSDLVRGDDMTDQELRAAIRDARALDLAVVVKPHIWVPDSWAGAIAMTSAASWQAWFANYRRELVRIAHIADEENAEALALGTELGKTTAQPQWSDLIAEARRSYRGRLLYVAHNVEEAETVPFWDRLDNIGVTLYPPLGDDNAREGRRNTMRAIADRLDVLSARTGKSIIVGEIGLRSAAGAAAKPWQSAEERTARPAPDLQSQVLADWLQTLDRPSMQGILIWRWLSDPAAGGLSDTDFTVQGKPAERLLMCTWTRSCP